MLGKNLLGDKMKLEDPILEELLVRAEQDETGKLMKVVQALILTCCDAAEAGITPEELEQVCKTGFMLGQNPEFLDIVSYLIQRGMNSDTEH
jgi:hypothetical protein